MLGKASELKADVAAHVKYVDTLKQAAKEYAEAVQKGKALETADTGANRRDAEGAEKGDV